MQSHALTLRHAQARPVPAELAELFALRTFRDARPASAFLPMPDSLVRAFAGEA